MKVREGNVFTSVCHSVGGGGRYAWAMSLLVGYADSQGISRFEGKVMLSLVCVILSGGRGYAWSMSLLGRYASCQVPSRFGEKVMFSLVCVILSGAI